MSEHEPDTGPLRHRSRNDPLIFPEAPADKAALEDGAAFTPRFDANGLITAVVTDAGDGELLMVAHMNAEALALTIETGIAHYFALARRALEEGRDLRQSPEGGGNPHRLRPGCHLAAGQSVAATMQPVTPAAVPASTGR